MKLVDLKIIEERKKIGETSSKLTYQFHTIDLLPSNQNMKK